MNTKTNYTLDELAADSGFEVRTIRSYIERGLLPSAQSRGRSATYLQAHLDRLRVIKMLRRAWPNLGLAEIRIRLQQLTPENIRALSEGRIGADPVSTDRTAETAALQNDDGIDEDEFEGESAGSIGNQMPADQFAGIERLVHALRQVTGQSGETSVKVQSWQRICVTEDIELSVRSEFNETQLLAFRELADLLRDAVTRVVAIPNPTTSAEHPPEDDA